MFKLAIVEDEDNIRHSLECFIPWEQIGFQVVGTFGDGTEALAYLRENPCDVVLTDILMSRMSGLELTRNLYHLNPQIKVVILSGHSDFAYAQQAIEYKVTHYLVKPVDEDELMSVFHNIKQQLDERHAELSVAELETRELKQMLQRSFFRDLLSGRVNSVGELNVYLKLLGLERVHKGCQLLAFNLKTGLREQEDSAEEPAEYPVEEFLQKQLADHADACCIFTHEERSGQWSVVFIGLSQWAGSQLSKFCGQVLQSLAAFYSEKFCSPLTYHLTHCVTEIGELLADAKPIAPCDQAISEQQVDQSLCEAVVSDYKLLIVELDLGSEDTLVHILNGIIYDLKDTPIENVRFVLKNLYSFIELHYKKRKVNVWNITKGRFDFNHLYRCSDMNSLADCLRQDFCALCCGLKTRKQGSEHSVVGHLVQYLNTHLDEDIGHDVIATKYRMHPGYLSRLFKQEMGETLSEYLLRIKTERAAQLLKEGQYKIGEIAGMVGYSAASYFSIMFKKFTGYSPREYSQRISL